jgi:hypothetical protein
MISPILLAALIAGGSIIGAMARRQQLNAKRARARLLDDACTALDHSKIRLGLDGFPVLEGLHRGRPCRVELIADSMTAGRLPQLWLVVTRQQAHENLSSLGMLIRPNAGDFFSITQGFNSALTAPACFPPNVLVRGRDAGSQATLKAVSESAGKILLEDSRIKELVIGPGGSRIVWQAGEGDRGNHQFLRQMRFLDTALGADVVTERIAVLDDISRSLGMRVLEAA